MALSAIRLVANSYEVPGTAIPLLQLPYKLIVPGMQSLVETLAGAIELDFSEDKVLHGGIFPRKWKAERRLHSVLRT